jgi:hypothetical protein
MPVHDWSRVPAGVFRAFHNAWIGTIQEVLNNGLLPPDFYALGEPIAGTFRPDVLTLQAVDVTPPQVSFTAETEMDEYVRKQQTLIIRHCSNDRLVALVENAAAALAPRSGGLTGRLALLPATPSMPAAP